MLFRSSLYIGSGSVQVLNSAQQLLNILYNNGNVNFALTNANTQVQAFAYGGGSTSVGITLTGDVTGTGSLPGTVGTTLSATGVTAGTYGSSTQVPVITVDSKGRIDTVSLVNITAGTTYSNANVAAYLPTDPTINSINANVYAANVNISTLSANLGADRKSTRLNSSH